MTLVGIFPLITWTFSSIEKTKQLFDLKISKGLEYSIWMEPLLYKEGAINRGLEWKEHYREYLLHIRHVSKQLDVVNLLFEADMPTGIVKVKIESQEGCEGLVLNYSDPFSDRGIIVENIKQGLSRVKKTYTQFTNNLYVTATRIFPGGRLALRIILTYGGDVSSPDTDGYITSKYSLKSRSGSLKEMKDKYRIEVIDSNTKRLSMVRNEGQHYKSYVLQPEKPLIFTNNGRIIVEDNTNSNDTLSISK